MRFPKPALKVLRLCALALLAVLGVFSNASAQRIQFPNNGLRPVQGGTASTLTPLPQVGNAPSLPSTLGTFDPYRSAPTTTGPMIGGPIVPVPNSAALGQANGVGGPSIGSAVLPAQGSGYPNSGIYPAPGYGYTAPGGYSTPGYNGYGAPNQGGLFANPQGPITQPGYGQPGIYSNPNSVFPGNTAYPNQRGPFGGFFQDLWGGITGQPRIGQPNYGQPNQPYGWNPPGSLFPSGQTGAPGFIRLFQGPRFRHAYIMGNDDTDALSVHDSDLSLAFAVPNFLGSTQPLYLLPSFSLHQWAGPFAPATADLPAVAYSAFLDAGWQTDPNRILGAELGLRVGMFSDFNTANTDSLRIMGRGIGRINLTPRATLKLGVIYLDRNRIKLLPAGGILWQPQPNTRFDIFFPEPKFSSYLSTFGNADTWWYVTGSYGGGAWTVQRANNSKDSIDINDIRVSIGLEFGQNDAMRQGRRNAFFEVGYVFERELLYQASPMDNLNLQDSIVFRAGFGY